MCELLTEGHLVPWGMGVRGSYGAGRMTFLCTGGDLDGWKKLAGLILDGPLTNALVR